MYTPTGAGSQGGELVVKNAAPRDSYGQNRPQDYVGQHRIYGGRLLTRHTKGVTQSRGTCGGQEAGRGGTFVIQGHKLKAMGVSTQMRHAYWQISLTIGQPYR